MAPWLGLSYIFAMENLAQLLRYASPNMDSISSFLDSLPHEQRTREVLALRKNEQSALFQAAAGFRPISVDHFVPANAAPFSEVIHLGRNTLPVFSHFAKVFCRPMEPGEDLLGYNRTGTVLQTTVGPGYFRCGACEVDGEVLVDYLRQPLAHPPHWPRLLPIDARLSRFVYHTTQDVLRGVTEHVSIGQPRRDGKFLPSWFVLCRENP